MKFFSPTFVRNRACLVVGILLASAVADFALAAAAGGTGPGDVIQMPPFETRGQRPWLYVAVPGYEVLSLEDERATRRIAEELQRGGRFLPMFFPPGSRLDFASPTALFLDRFSRNTAIAESQQKAGPNLRVGSYSPVADGFAPQFFHANVVSRLAAGRSSSAGYRFFSTAMRVNPRLPAWYLEGLNRLLESAEVSAREIEFDAGRWAVVERVVSPERRGLPGLGLPVPGGKKTSPPKEWVAPSLLPMGELLEVRTLDQSIERSNAWNGFRASYVDAAGLFIHWGFFSGGAERRTAFVAFAGSDAPPDDDKFRRHFGMTMDEQRTDMFTYAARERSNRARLVLPPELATAPLVPVVVRPAERAEVARLTGQSYVILGAVAATETARQRYLAMAREVLGDAHAAGDRQPGLLAALAHLEAEQDRLAEARPLVEAAVAAGAATPYLFQLQARLRLDEAGVRMGDGRLVTPATLERVFAPLRASLELRPQLPEAAAMLADLRLRGSGSAPVAELDLLGTAAREIRPASAALLTSVAELELRSGRTEEARALVAQALALPSARDPRVGLRLMTLRVALEAARAGAPR